MPSFRGVICCLLLLGSLVAAAPGIGQTPPADPERGELDRRIEELRKQIADLLAAAPAKNRDEIIRRLLEAPPVESSPKAAPQPQPTAESEPRTPPPAPRPIVTAPASEEAARAEETVAEARETPPPPRRRRARKCNTLDFLDENGDGQISAADRHWRHLYLWIDKNRDSTRQEKEIVSAYAAGVREIALDLETFTRRKGALGEIRRGEGLLFDLGANGFGQSRRVDDGLLLIDTEALARGNGPRILGPDRNPIRSVAAWARGWSVRLDDGSEAALTCP